MTCIMKTFQWTNVIKKEILQLYLFSFIYRPFLHDKNTLHKRETILNLRLNTVSANSVTITLQLFESLNILM